MLKQNMLITLEYELGDRLSKFEYVYFMKDKQSLLCNVLNEENMEDIFNYCVRTYLLLGNDFDKDTNLPRPRFEGKALDLLHIKVTPLTDELYKYMELSKLASQSDFISFDVFEDWVLGLLTSQEFSYDSTVSLYSAKENKLIIGIKEKFGEVHDFVNGHVESFKQQISQPIERKSQLIEHTYYQQKENLLKQGINFDTEVVVYKKGKNL